MTVNLKQTRDFIDGTRHLYTRIRTDGINVMSLGFSGGKQAIKSANTRNRGFFQFSRENNDAFVYFHMLVRIVRIAPVVSKYFETIRTTGAIGSFHMIVSIASKARNAGSPAMSLGQTIEFLRVSCKQAT